MGMLIFILIFIAVVVFLFYKEWKRLQHIKTNWKPNDKPQAISMIVADFNRAKKRVLIYGGEPDIYNEDSIMEAIKSALQRDVNIEIICETKPIDISKFQVGPEMKSGYIFSVATQKKVFRHHFRVVDYDYVYIEKPHLPGSDDRRYKQLFNVRFLPGDYAKEFQQIRESALVET